MTSADAKPTASLEGVVATASAICYLDGSRGVLAYSGLDIHDLATHATFEGGLLSPVASPPPHRLIRPRAEYIGPPYPQTFVALDRR